MFIRMALTLTTSLRLQALSLLLQQFQTLKCLLLQALVVEVAERTLVAVVEVLVVLFHYLLNRYQQPDTLLPLALVAANLPVAAIPLLRALLLLLVVERRAPLVVLVVVVAQ
jgi:hypothetical protein